MRLPRAEDDHAWLSAHLFFEGDIYEGPGDRMVHEVVEPVVTACRGEARRWFFIRYSEAGSHIRLRFFAPPEAHEVLRPRILAAAEDSELVEGVSWVEYEPEVERYGGPHGLVLAETYFHDSSEIALALLRKIPLGDRSSRLGKALLAMLVVLYLFEETPELAAELATMYAQGYLRSRVADPEQQEQWLTAFSDGYDRQSDQLADYVETAWAALVDDDAITPELDLYRERMGAVRDRLRKHFDAGRLQFEGTAPSSWQQAARRIMPSYLHMTNNRLGVSVQEESYLSVLISMTFDQVQTAEKTD